MAPLVLSPLCIAIANASDVVANRTPRLGLEIIGFAAVYSTLLTLWWWFACGRKQTPMQTRPFLALFIRGTFWGAMFGLLLFVPYFTTQAIVDHGKMTFSNTVGRLTFMLYCVWTFTLIGTACGGLTGLILPRATATLDVPHQRDRTRTME